MALASEAPLNLLDWINNFLQVIDGREPLTTLKEAKTALFTHDAGERKSNLFFSSSFLSC